MWNLKTHFQVLEIGNTFHVSVSLSLCIAQAGVPHIPHGRSAQYYTLLLQNKELPSQTRPNRQPYDMDADVIVKRPRHQHVRRAGQKPKKRRRSGPESSDEAEEKGVGSVGIVAWEPNDMADEEDDEFCVGSVGDVALLDDEAEEEANTFCVGSAGEVASEMSMEAMQDLSAMIRELDAPMSQTVEEAGAPLAPRSSESVAPESDRQVVPVPGPDAIAMAVAEPVLEDGGAAQPPEARAGANELMVDSGYFGIFRFTRTRRGFSARCPFHRRNKTTDCKKMISVTTAVGQPISRADTVMCWRRLATWCLAHNRFTRQRDHVGFTPAANDNEVRGLEETCVSNVFEFVEGGDRKRQVSVSERTDVLWGKDVALASAFSCRFRLQGLENWLGWIWCSLKKDLWLLCVTLLPVFVLLILAHLPVSHYTAVVTTVCQCFAIGCVDNKEQQLGGQVLLLPTLCSNFSELRDQKMRKCPWIWWMNSFSWWTKTMYRNSHSETVSDRISFQLDSCQESCPSRPQDIVFFYFKI